MTTMKRSKPSTTPLRRLCWLSSFVRSSFSVSLLVLLPLLLVVCLTTRTSTSIMIFQSIVLVDSFQLNNKNNVVLPLSCQHVSTRSRTKAAATTFIFGESYSGGKSKSRRLRSDNCNNNNNNDLIRLHLSAAKSNQESFSLPEETTTTTRTAKIKNIKKKKATKKKKAKKTSTQRKQAVAAPKKTTVTKKTIEPKQKQKHNLNQNQNQKRSLRTWEYSFELLKQYKEENGDCLVPNKYDPDKKLGLWVQTQRQYEKNGKLKPEQKVKLDSLGFSWEAKSSTWNYMFEELKEFKEDHGHCNVERDKDKSRQALAYWVVNQRKNRHLLTNEQRSQLDELGFVWKDVANVRLEREWEERFEALKDYYSIYGHTRVPYGSAHNNFNLGAWVKTQRQYFRQGRLRKDREEKLNSIGFVWKLRDVNTTDYEKLEKNWMKNFDKLKKFKSVQNHTNVPKKYEKSPKLGKWVFTQRNNYRLGLLNKNRQELLDSIGFEWNYQEKTFKEKWTDRYQSLVEFRNEYGHVDVPSNSHSTLYDWLFSQRALFANGKLESDRKELLEKIGINLNVGAGSGNIQQ